MGITPCERCSDQPINANVRPSKASETDEEKEFTVRRWWKVCLIVVSLGLAAQMSLGMAHAQDTRRIQGPTATDARAPVQLVALPKEGGTALTQGLHWRVYAAPTQPDQPLILVTESTQASPTVTLAAGAYIIHAAYGLAGLAKRVVVGTTPARETFVLDAGTLKMTARAPDRELNKGRLKISLYVPEAGLVEGRLIADDIPSGQAVRLPAGVYSLVSVYGDGNAVVRGDARVEAGRLTEILMTHRAAAITLKLVSEPGGEALANTSWSVLTPGGDTVREFIGAFPSLMLAEGTYTVIARYEGQIFTHEFRVQNGIDKDVEVLAKP